MSHCKPHRKPEHDQCKSRKKKYHHKHESCHGRKKPQHPRGGSGDWPTKH